MKKLCFLFTFLFLLLTSCEAPGTSDYCVVGHVGTLCESAASLDLGETTLICEQGGRSYVNPDVLQTRTVKILDQEYTVHYTKTDIYPTQDRYFDVYELGDYEHGGVVPTFYTQTDTLRSLSFYDESIEKPRFPLPLTPKTVQAFLEEEILPEGVKLSDWDESCKSYYTVSYRQGEGVTQDSGSEERFLSHAPLPQGAVLIDQTIEYAFFYDLSLGGLDTDAHITVLCSSDGTLNRLEVQNPDLPLKLSGKNISARGLERFCMEAVRHAHADSKHKITSVTLSQPTLCVDLDSEPYFEIAVAVEYQDEDSLLCDCQNDLVLKICRSDVLKNKAALGKEYAKELSERYRASEELLSQNRTESSDCFYDGYELKEDGTVS